MRAPRTAPTSGTWSARSRDRCGTNEELVVGPTTNLHARSHALAAVQQPQPLPTHDRGTATPKPQATAPAAPRPHTAAGVLGTIAALGGVPGAIFAAEQF